MSTTVANGQYHTLVAPPPYRPIGRLAAWCQGALAAATMLSAVAMIVELRARNVLAEPLAQLTVARAEHIDDVARVSGLANLLGYLGAGIVFIIWLHRAAHNVRGLGATNLAHSPGWAIGGWFVPFVNLARPYQVTAEVWKASAPGYEPGTNGWTGDKVPGLVPLWWALWIVVGLASIAQRATGGDTFEELRDQYAVAAFGDLVTVAAGIAALTVVRRLTARQQQRAVRMARLGYLPPSLAQPANV